MVLHREIDSLMAPRPDLTVIPECVAEALLCGYRAMTVGR